MTRASNQRGRCRSAVLVTIIVTVLVACATTRPTAEWRDDSYTGAFADVLIVGVADRKGVRRLFEDSFVARLRDEDVRAVSSAAVLPAGTRVTKEELEPVIKARKLDAVLVTHLLGVEKGETYHPPSYTVAPSYGGLYGYHRHVATYVYQPGYYSRYELVKLETNLYDASSGKLVWSMQTETMDPGGVQELIDAKIDAVVSSLKAQELL